MNHYIYHLSSGARFRELNVHGKPVGPRWTVTSQADDVIKAKTAEGMTRDFPWNQRVREVGVSQHLFVSTGSNLACRSVPIEVLVLDEVTP